MASIKSPWYTTKGEKLLLSKYTQIFETLKLEDPYIQSLFVTERDPRDLVKDITMYGLITQGQKEKLAYPLIKQLGIVQMTAQWEGDFEEYDVVKPSGMLLGLLEVEVEVRNKCLELLDGTEKGVSKESEVVLTKSAQKENEKTPHTEKKNADVRSPGALCESSKHPRTKECVLPVTLPIDLVVDLTKSRAHATPAAVTSPAHFRLDLADTPAKANEPSSRTASIKERLDAEAEDIACLADKEDNTEDEGVADEVYTVGCGKEGQVDEAGSDDGVKSDFKKQKTDEEARVEQEEDWTIVAAELESESEMV